MNRPRLIGREDVVTDVAARLRAGRSVLLVGPAGSGKSAIIDSVRREGLIVVDPFAGITTPRAATLRRALDSGAIVIGATRSLDLRTMGHVGRIAWRFEPVYLRPLSPRAIRRILCQALEVQPGARLAADRRWLAEAVAAAQGIPGDALALASAAAARWRPGRPLWPPRLALVMARQDQQFGKHSTFSQTGLRPKESSA